MKVTGLIGIYKIVNPNGRIYIGQSVDLKRRLKCYELLNCKDQHKIYNSLKKHGYDKHEVDIIEQCEIDRLNERERYWMEHYKSYTPFHLNCSIVRMSNRSGRMTDETRARMSVAQKLAKSLNKKPRKPRKKKPSKIQCQEDKDRAYHKAKFKSKEWLEAVIKSNKERIFTPELRVKLGHRKGVTLTEEHKMKIRANATKTKAKIVVNLETGVFYESAKEAAFAHNINHGTLKSRMNPKAVNKSNLIYI